MDTALKERAPTNVANRNNDTSYINLVNNDTPIPLK